ncbi:cardiolipin synthase [Hathewaya proteolytica DSM 3090]|uniref:Cardiolipin synthase n=1 Tax=Hathewaya proteolytica DSM 3090 TaxID=1121331 RepID=A0A1M6SGR6_9CLOT|nr:cardiolipin synthase [Hathewaya proteolytica]SHK43941.1 cardiolipin synthase [Hathewaya proteolytica DSM 3090]
MGTGAIVALIFTILFLNLVLSIALIFIERKDTGSTWAWLFVLNVLPVIGFFIYLMFGQNFTREKRFRKKIIGDSERKSYFEKKRKLYKFDRDMINNIDMIEMNYQNCKSMYTQLNEVELYFDGNDKFESLIQCIKNAKKYIHIEYYIFRKDDIGKEIIDLLVEKLKEGVEVKLLVDAMGSGKLNHKKNIRDFVEAGGEFAVFFPGLTAHINMRINYRDHRKIVVIDGECGFLGGFNVGDEYLGRYKSIGNWRDTHFKVVGEAILDLEERFLMDWSYASEEDIADVERYFEVKEVKNSNVGIQIVSSGPDHDQEFIKNGYVKIVNNAKQYLYLQTPYFVPDETVMQCLRICALSGVDVRIMIPANPDHIFMGWAASSYVDQLMDAGVKVYYYHKGFLHAKTMVSDDAVSSIGTANMDIRSFRLNFETNAFIYNEKIALQMKEQFEKDMEDCTLVTTEIFAKRGTFMKIAESIVRLLSPIL